jgi:guanylate kinase
MQFHTKHIILPHKNNMSKSFLVTLTATSCSGKSFLFDYIRDEARLPCLISTTTRAPRANEVHGRDYYFISHEESIRLEQEGKLAELAIYNGNRYGVTTDEFFNKLSKGIAFLIVEPTGVEHYAKPAVDAGASHMTVYVDVPLDVRLERFKTRATNDVIQSAMTMNPDNIAKTVATALKRQQSMLTEELTWHTASEWDLIVDGRDAPADNLKKILDKITKTGSSK